MPLLVIIPIITLSLSIQLGLESSTMSFLASDNSDTTMVSDNDLPNSSEPESSSESDSESDGPDSDASDASFMSVSSTVSLPRVFPFVTPNDCGDLAQRQAIAEIWVEYIPVRSSMYFRESR
ncbi:hypothetical protein B0H11DRAFT_2061318 [Mycena galericulata]|nr:hypothetical protein B0H11DRAFT_2061318 [Mycena galericulata]